MLSSHTHTPSGGLRRPSRRDVYIPDPGELYKHPLIGDNYICLETERNSIQNLNRAVDKTKRSLGQEILSSPLILCSKSRMLDFPTHTCCQTAEPSDMQGRPGLVVTPVSSFYINTDLKILATMKKIIEHFHFVLSPRTKDAVHLMYVDFLCHTILVKLS